MELGAGREEGEVSVGRLRLFHFCRCVVVWRGVEMCTRLRRMHCRSHAPLTASLAEYGNERTREGERVSAWAQNGVSER